MKNLCGVLSILLTSTFLATALTACDLASISNLPLVIAVAEGQPGELGSPPAQSIYSGVKLAVDEVNRQGGVNGQKVEIVLYADGDDPAVAYQNAQAIVDGRALLVIGHSSSETSRASAQRYTEAGIPVINASPDSDSLTVGYPVYFNIIYTAETQAAYMANYLVKVQGVQSAGLIYANDLYSLALAETFRNTFRGLGGEFLLTEEIDLARPPEEQVEQVDQMVARIISATTTPDQPSILYIAAPYDISAQLVLQLKRKGVAYPLAGSDQLNNTGFIAIMREQSEENAQPGFFTDGILSTRGLISDSVHGHTNELIDQYYAIYGQEPDDRVLAGYDAALTAMAAMQKLNLSNVQPGGLRTQLLSALQNLNSEQKILRGVTGDLSFQQNRQAVRPARFAVYQNGDLVSAMTQFEPVGSLPINDELRDALENGRMLTVYGEYVNIVNVVYTGVDLIEASTVDIKNSTYLLDFYLWFRYRNSVPETGLVPENIIFTNLASEESLDLGEPIREEQIGDSLLRTYRVTARFENEFKFHEYPFDQQTLLLQMRNQNATTSQVQYVVDRIGMQYPSNNDLLKYWQANRAFKGLFGWRPWEASAEQSILSTTSTLGSPHNFNRSSSTDYSMFQAFVEIRRSSMEYMIKSLLPLLITLVLAYITFFLPLGHSERMGVGSTALLTTAFFHLSLADSLPEIGYTVAMEFLFYASYLMSTLIVFLETWSSRIEKRAEDLQNGVEKEKLNEQRSNLNRAGKILYPSILLMTILFGGLVYANVLNLNPAFDTGISLSGQVARTVATPTAAATQGAEAAARSGEMVVLKISTWRPEDISGIEALAVEFEDYARSKGYNIDLEHDPIIGLNYDTIMQTQFNKNTAPDLLYVRPYSVDGFMANYLLPLDGNVIKGNFAANRSEPWKSKTGEYYAVPFVGVVQGVYYNREIFNALDLTEPKSWSEFLKTARVIKAAGYIPVANTLMNNQDSEMFQSLSISTIQGADGRMQLSEGTPGYCYNNARVVNAFQAIVDLKDYLPANADEISSDTSKTLFLDGKAPMLFGGSWDLKYISEQARFDWGVFAPPAPGAGNTFVVFNPDIGIGINKNSAHPDEALLFTEWLLTQEALDATARSLPGFYPLNNATASVDDQGYRDDFLTLANNYESDARWVYIDVSAKSPRADEIVRFALYDIFKNDISASDAANRLQSGLAEWYEPAQKCIR